METYCTSIRYMPRVRDLERVCFISKEGSLRLIFCDMVATLDLVLVLSCTVWVQKYRNIRDFTAKLDLFYPPDFN